MRCISLRCVERLLCTFAFGAAVHLLLVLRGVCFFVLRGVCTLAHEYCVRCSLVESLRLLEKGIELETHTHTQGY